MIDKLLNLFGKKSKDIEAMADAAVITKQIIEIVTAKSPVTKVVRTAKLAAKLAKQAAKVAKANALYEDVIVKDITEKDIADEPFVAKSKFSTTEKVEDNGIDVSSEHANQMMQKLYPELYQNLVKKAQEKAQEKKNQKSFEKEFDRLYKKVK